MKIFFTLIACMLAGLCSQAADQDRMRFGRESADTTRITEMVKICGSVDGGAGDRIIAAGQELLGAVYGGGTLECADGVERLTVNLDTLDCTTFVETVMALAMTAAERRLSWRDFMFNLERIRYRQGTMTNYVSRLHYISDWVLDNTTRGNFKEVTADIPGSAYMTKSLDFMSSHASAYPQLADSAVLAGIRRVEDGYRNWRYPFVKKDLLSKKAVAGALRDGDVVALTTSSPGLDVSHMGIVVKKNGVPHLMHASSARREVVIDPLPLYEYMRKSRSLTGIRVFRLLE